MRYAAIRSLHLNRRSVIGRQAVLHRVRHQVEEEGSVAVVAVAIAAATTTTTTTTAAVVVSVL